MMATRGFGRSAIAASRSTIVVQLRRLVAPDDLRARGEQRDLVRREELDEREHANDHATTSEDADVEDVHEDDEESDVDEPEDEHGQ